MPKSSQPKQKFVFEKVDPNTLPDEVLKEWEKSKVEANHIEKTGKIRPIIHADFKGYKHVAVGSQWCWGHWRTFVDFLFDYIKMVLTNDWRSAELKKSSDKRHQILNWYVEACNYQKRCAPDENGIYDAIPNGALAAYINLAYDLYLLNHHQFIQEDIIRRLKINEQFQGARYELFVAATCIKAGCNIEYENEKDRSRKHVEFIATHKVSGQKICVEAKSRHREGILGFPGAKKDDEDVKLRIGRLLNVYLSLLNLTGTLAYVG